MNQIPWSLLWLPIVVCIDWGHSVHTLPTAYVVCIDLGHRVHTIQPCIGKIAVKTLIKSKQILGCKQFNMLAWERQGGF